LFVPRLKPIVDYVALGELLAADESRLAAAAAAYEETLRTYFGAARVYALSSGRAAIALGLGALGIGRGDDVAIPAFTCPAVADAVLSLGAIPHLVDVSPRHFGLEARSLRRVLARGRTRAAVVAPLFGAVPPQEEIESLLGAPRRSARGGPAGPSARRRRWP
jgi:dTDP-4-amino-4,6-dideoxygalactose transaminase